MKLFRLSIVALSSCVLGYGCAQSGGTGTGNPGLTIASQGYNVSVARNSLLDFAIPNAFAATTSITDLKFCVTELKFTLANGSQLSIPRSSLGLIDLGAGTAPVTWGSVTVAAETSISRAHIEIHHDSETCSGATYSIQANGQTVTKDIELRFAFASPLTTDGSGTITFNLATIAAKIDEALQDGKFDNQHIEDYLDDELEGTATGSDDD